MTRSQRTSLEMFPLIEAYLDGGQSKKSFAALNDVPESVLGYWITKYRREKLSEASSFLEITPSAAPGEHVLMEVVYPHGVRVRLFSSPGAAELERLISAGRRVA